jgi:hypothetical protein
MRCRYLRTDVKKLLLILTFCCSGCSLLTPYAQWPNGTPMYPGAYKIETDKLKDPNYRPTTVEILQRKAACFGPEPSSICPSS